LSRRAHYRRGARRREDRIQARVKETRPARLVGSLTRQLRRVRAGAAEPFLGDVAIRAGFFAVVSDLQRTSGLEVWRESNRGERERIVARLSEERPDLLAILGDLVFHGSSVVDWAEFDQLMRPLRDAGVPVLPVLGNHDYWTRRRGALANYFARFPRLAGRHWYEARYGRLALLFLDSNERFLPPDAWAEQLQWFADALARADADDSVGGILVFQHHPPYTNSTITSDEVHVQRHLVPPFAAARKTLALFAGHVHSYERFSRGGKVYVVTGGGGGPRAPLFEREARRHADDLFAGPAVRSFHYLKVTPGADEVSIEMVALAKHATAFAVEDRFSLPFAAAVPA
jgi:Icc-related predicted phosphoesterase